MDTKSPILNPCNLYLTLWSAYSLQGTLYSSGSMFSQGLLAIILAMSATHTLLVFFNKRKPSFFKGLILLVIMYTFYGIILLATDGATTRGMVKTPPTYFYLKTYWVSLLPIFSFYYYTTKGYLNLRIYRKWVIVLFLLAIAEFFRMQRETILLVDNDDITNNGGYVMLSIIPCLLVFKKSWQQMVLVLISVAFILFSIKRGAIATAAIVVCVYLFQNFKSLKRWERFFYIAAIAIVGLIGIILLKDTLLVNDYFNYRIQQTLEGDSSGRTAIYQYLIDYYANYASFIQQLVGFGAFGTIKISPQYAHNDWLETLINQGLLGIIIFLFYWVRFAKTCRTRTLSSSSRKVLILVFVIMLFRTFFSMSIGDNSVYISSILGFALADGFFSPNDNSDRQHE